MDISVITPSVRPAGRALVDKALRRQTLQTYEWIVQPREAALQPGDYWTVYKDMNIALKKATGKLIISWQDYTYANPDTLERFWEHYKDEPQTLVGAVGNKYADDTWTVVTWKDPRERENDGTYHLCDYQEVEFNLASIPKAAFYAVGGYDESLDKYSSVCGLDVSARLEILGGWQFKLDQSIKSYSLEHPRLPAWEEHLPFGGPWKEHLQQYLVHPKLSYLHSHK